ncbi:MAG: hypothetical protein KIT32_12005 [Rhodocyclaceae bacterium]|nr:hypothetical protein [Rhodocyclaceae bacterium]
MNKDMIDLAADVAAASASRYGLKLALALNITGRRLDRELWEFIKISECETLEGLTAAILAFDSKRP